MNVRFSAPNFVIWLLLFLLVPFKFTDLVYILTIITPSEFFSYLTFVEFDFQWFQALLMAPDGMLHYKSC